MNCLAALQTQLEAGDRVVLVSSMAHWLPFPRAEAYGASKAALSWFANSLRLDWELERGRRHGGLSGLRRQPADAQKRLRHELSRGRRAWSGSRRGSATVWRRAKTTHRLPTGFSLALRLLASLPSGIQRLLLRMVRS